MWFIIIYVALYEERKKNKQIDISMYVHVWFKSKHGAPLQIFLLVFQVTG
jgi:hypothetical protein